MVTKMEVVMMALITTTKGCLSVMVVALVEKWWGVVVTRRWLHHMYLVVV